MAAVVADGGAARLRALIGLAAVLLFVSSLAAQEPAFPYLYIEVLEPTSGKVLQPQQGVIRVSNSKRIRLQIKLRARDDENRYADLFIKALNQHPETKREVTVELSVRRLVDGRREDVPFRVNSSGGGKNLTIHYVSADIDILDLAEKRAAEMRQLLGAMLTEAQKQGPAGRFGELARARDQLVPVFDEQYINNPRGDYEVQAVYSTRQPGMWTGRLQSKPVHLRVEYRGDLYERAGLKKPQSWPIAHTHDHVQGLDVDEHWFWISAVDRRTKTGWIWRVDRATLRTVIEREITDGPRYHPGGFQVSGSSLWIPVAEYRANSSARILELDSMTLTERRSFLAGDHIGALATEATTLLGANWDARKFYRWDLGGRLLEAVSNPRTMAIQDMKWVNGILYAGGNENGTCWLDRWLNPPKMNLLPAWSPGRDRCYTREGMAVFGGQIFFLPEDEPNSRVYAIEAPR